MRRRITKPTPAELRDAVNRTVPDLVGPALDVLFVGINPGLYSGAVGHHFARPGNRFWPALYRAGFTPRLLSPFEETELLRHGCGVTNLVHRTTASAAELSRAELAAGAGALERCVRRYHPTLLAFLGIGAYRLAMDRPRASLGPQEELFAEAKVWVLPNPSGLNAHYQLDELSRLFRELRRAIDRS
jgi:double-stranded uracil-DNA glycosylase